MIKSMNKLQRGFTIIELLIVIAIIAILAGLALNSFQASKARDRDIERIQRISEINSKLEEFYNEASGYPADASNIANFPNMDASSIKDLSGSIIKSSVVADKAAMLAAPDPKNGAGTEFVYVTYPTGCDMYLSEGSYRGTPCLGYRLMSYIELPNKNLSNPYIKLGLQNP